MYKSIRRKLNLGKIEGDEHLHKGPAMRSAGHKTSGRERLAKQNPGEEIQGMRRFKRQHKEINYSEAECLKRAVQVGEAHGSQYVVGRSSVDSGEPECTKASHMKAEELIPSRKKRKNLAGTNDNLSKGGAGRKREKSEASTGDAEDVMSSLEKMMFHSRHLRKQVEKERTQKVSAQRAEQHASARVEKIIEILARLNSHLVRTGPKRESTATRASNDLGAEVAKNASDLEKQEVSGMQGELQQLQLLVSHVGDLVGENEAAEAGRKEVEAEVLRVKKDLATAICAAELAEAEVCSLLKEMDATISAKQVAESALAEAREEAACYKRRLRQFAGAMGQVLREHAPED